jgi:protein-S-isoprenylcysteine O-methyltransferase Ste14
MLLLRATFAFLALPTLVAGVVPVLLVRGTPIAHKMMMPGGALLAVGGILLLWCVRDFFVSGHGTLAPWDPPKRLVMVGLYRFTRNPMYVAVLTVVVGWSVLYSSAWLLLYALALAVAFHLRVRFHEEPWLRRQFGSEWETYAGRTSRWIPRLRCYSK